MARMVYARLTQQEIAELVRVSREARRHPSDQVALYVTEALKQARPATPLQDTARQPAEAGTH